MYFTQALITALMASGALARVIKRDGDWSIQALTRSCNADDTSCSWSFRIYDGETTSCEMVSQGSKIPITTPVPCGAYSLTTGYDANMAFTTMAVVNYNAGLIIYPSYTDAELSDGSAADLTQTPQALP